MSQALSNVFKLKDIINVKDPAFGAKGDASTDDTAAIQAAINAVASDTTKGGGIVFFPKGFYRTTAPLVINSGCIIAGSGTGAGIGTGNSGGTVIRSGAAAGDVFTVNSANAVTFRDLTIDAPSVTKAANTAGIRLAGAAGAGTTNRGSRILNCRILNMYDGVITETGADFVISACRITNYLNIGIYHKQTGGVDDGQNVIESNVIWDLSVGTSQACIRYDKGGDLRIHNNKLLGSDFGFRLALDDGPTGTLILTSNSIETQLISAVKVQQAVTQKEFAMLVINNNQFQSSGNPAGYQSTISIEDGTPLTSASWIRLLNIIGNTIQIGHSRAFPQISIQGGAGGVVQGNTINLANQSGPTGIATGGSAQLLHVADNPILNPSSTPAKYGNINANTVWIDRFGFPFANLKNSANGSVVYVTDGTKGSDPLTGSGTGAIATRINGAWVGT